MPPSSGLEQTYETLAPPPFTADFPGPPLASLRPIGSHWPFDLVGKKNPGGPVRSGWALLFQVRRGMSLLPARRRYLWALRC